VDRSRKTAATNEFSSLAWQWVSVTETDSSPHQQSGTIQTGNPWWPGGESNCSVGLSRSRIPVVPRTFSRPGTAPTTSTAGVRRVRPAQNKIGTSNGRRHAQRQRTRGRHGPWSPVTEPAEPLRRGEHLGQPAVTITARPGMVGDRVCHSGNTSHWQCGMSGIPQIRRLWRWSDHRRPDLDDGLLARGDSGRRLLLATRRPVCMTAARPSV